MITRWKGDLLAVKQGILVHGCNCVGVMGAGIAAQVARRWPAVEAAYVVHCEDLGDKALGTITFHDLNPGLFIINAMTQLAPGLGKQVSYDAVELCFKRILQIYEMGHYWDVPLCFPALGAGLAGGKWPIIEAIIDETIPDRIEKRLYIL